MRRLTLALLPLLAACVAPLPGPGVEPVQDDDDGSTFADLMARPRVEGGTRGTLEVDMPELGQTTFDAIYVEPAQDDCLQFERFLAGDGISCEAWYQWEQTCRQAEREGVAAPSMQGWDRFFGEPPWILATYEDFDQLLDEAGPLPEARDVYFEIDQYSADYQAHQLDIFDDYGPGLLLRAEEDDRGLQLEFATPLLGLYYFWDGQGWALMDQPIDDRALVQWIDVPRCAPAPRL